MKTYKIELEFSSIKSYEKYKKILQREGIIFPNLRGAKTKHFLKEKVEKL